MAKNEVRRELKESEAQEPRKLNMEEKRKLEKLLLSDIDSAVGRYNAEAEGMRRALMGKLVKNPPAGVKKLFERYVLAKRQAKEAELKLDALGFDLAYDGTLSVNTNGTLTPQLSAFDELTKKMRQSLQDLKRSYVIKLFADHADTQSLFAALAKDLERLIVARHNRASPRRLSGEENGVYALTRGWAAGSVRV
jgi:hypothetical protein